MVESPSTSSLEPQVIANCILELEGTAIPVRGSVDGLKSD
jgi:hypothetical protein